VWQHGSAAIAAAKAAAIAVPYFIMAIVAASAATIALYV
jgi:hypothetical protein